MAKTNRPNDASARRQLQREIEARRARELARRRRTAIASIIGSIVAVIAVVAIVIVAVNSGDDNKPAAKSGASTPAASTPASGTPSSSASKSSYPCSWPTSSAAARKVTKPSTLTPARTGTAVVKVQTNRGAMVFTLDRAAAPCTVESFVSLVKQRFFDNTPCPRVENTNLFILQCGDPTGTGTGGPGYSIPDEVTGKERYTAGVLAMANSGAPNSGGSQFFIVYKPDQLPPSYTIFGKVTQGLNVVEKVAAAGNDGSNQAGGGRPKLPINLTRLTVES